MLLSADFSLNFNGNFCYLIFIAWATISKKEDHRRLRQEPCTLSGTSILQTCASKLISRIGNPRPWLTLRKYYSKSNKKTIDLKANVSIPISSERSPSYLSYNSLCRSSLDIWNSGEKFDGSFGRTIRLDSFQSCHACLIFLFDSGSKLNQIIYVSWC